MVSLAESFKLEVSSVKLEKVCCRALWPLVSHFSEKRLTASLRTGPKCAKRTQFRSAGAVSARNEPSWAPQRARAGGKCAKRSQTWRDWGMWANLILGRQSASHGETCKTNPIWTTRPGMGAGWRDAVPGRRAIVRNEPNFQLRIADFRLRIGRGVGRAWLETACRGNPRRGKMRRTNPIWPPRGPVLEEIVQNKAKVGETGAYGQRQLPCGRSSAGE
jgi:hypothetical protein